MLKARVVQGQGAAIPVTVDATPLDPGSALVGTISDGLTGPPLLPFTPAWSDAGPPVLVITLNGNQTASLPPGGYVIQVGLADGGGPLAYGSLQVLPAPNNEPLFDVLTTPGRMLLANPILRDDPDRVAALPLAIRAASSIVRRLCCRRFTRGVYTEYIVPSLEGAMRLNEFPVNQILRVSHKLRDAVEITADASTYQTAYVNFSTIDGDYAEPRNLIYTGLNLVSASNGVASTHNLPFATMATLQDLVDAVDAVPGWKATAGGYAAWPIGELYRDATSRGALTGGARFQVFSEDASPQRVDRRAGFVYMGHGRDAGFGPRWGPGWDQFDGYGLASSGDAVRITYDAGFTEIPDAVQHATMEMARLVMDRMLIDYTLKSESIGTYKYELNDKLLAVAVPEAIRGTLALYIGYTA